MNNVNYEILIERAIVANLLQLSILRRKSREYSPVALYFNSKPI